jgi:hypothetical protein
MNFPVTKGPKNTKINSLKFTMVGKVIFGPPEKGPTHHYARKINFVGVGHVIPRWNGLHKHNKKQKGTYALKLIFGPKMAKKGPKGKKCPPPIGRKMQSLSYSAFKCNVFRCN